MAQSIRLWTIEGDSGLRELSQTKLNLESRLESWLEADISILENNLLVIGRQVATDYGGYIDLLCIDGEGDLVVLELKRDKTPREIVAQALDYASWITDLSEERVTRIANDYLGTRGPLEKAFSERFRTELPETINQAHKILVAAAVIDPSSERIIRYLSSVHGVNINAATFQYFRDPEGRELLARVFLLEPERVEQRAEQGRSPKRRKLSLEELETIAEERGVGELYRQLVDTFRTQFDYTRTTGSSISFKAGYLGSRNVMLNLIPQESSAERGVKFQLYGKRVMHRFGIQADGLAAALPSGTVDWSYYDGAPDDWAGYQGFFASREDALKLTAAWEASRRSRAPE
jgi:hypothetical protein